MGASPLGPLAGLYVVVVEDDADGREILRQLLTYLGAFVMTAENAQDALNKLTQVKAHVVICDVHLGDSDALWLIREVRKLKASTPFIAVSGHDYDEEVMRGAGFVKYLPKPIDHEALIRAISTAVDR